MTAGNESYRRGTGGILSTLQRTPFVSAAVVAWTVAAVAMLTVPDASRRVVVSAGHVLRPVSHASARAVGAGHVAFPGAALVGLVLGALLLASATVVRGVRRPLLGIDPYPPGTLAAVSAIVEEHGGDSLAPFVVRPDKRFEFAFGAVAAYRVIAETAVVSGDPVGPPGRAAGVIAQLRSRLRPAGLRVVMYGCSERYLDDYRRLGMRAVCVGEEAVIDPARFTLEGRPVRKLRQSVHRIERRGWQITALRGREIDAALETEIDALEAAWRGQHGRMLGFAMSMGRFDPGVRPSDLYLLARSPEGDLRAAMRFIDHCGKLSLDTMRRVGETPNGLNEALVCRALELARSLGVPEVSLNYAGLAHLVRRGPSGGPVKRVATRALLLALGRRFQMDRLVRFNEKFSPEWRPRYLVYESRPALPRSAVRVLQAEGYLSEPGSRRWSRADSAGWVRALAAVIARRAQKAGR